MSEEAEAASPKTSSSDAPAGAPGLVTIDLDALASNYRHLRERAAPAECAAVVKADAYGLGAAKVAPVLWREGCRTFYVATLAEGRSLRALLPEATIYAFDGLMPRTADLFADLEVRPVLNSIDEIREWAAHCRMAGKRLPAGLHLDSGMNRLGLPEAELDAVASDRALLESFELSLVMSHLACSDTPEHPKNQAQRDRFDALRRRLPDVPASLANSGGVMLGESYHFNQVRPGIALYGGQPAAGNDHRFENVVTLESRILQLRTSPAGDTIGYGATRHIDAPRRIATIAAGYADGISWLLSAGDGKPPLSVYLGPHPAPVMGRISMDLITVDVTDIPDEYASRGAMVQIIGPRQPIEAIAEQAQTVNYEILTNLCRRAARRYVGGDA
ncbi:Alanine racemase, biosynthetic [Methyloligella halotolerans]|uniref:Alanine racemase n=1 Tax=Methyloligella halotolerans TaxID=1177755 RepID=A0A1E2S1S9_9HYPH|nr:alanine racemase [Methyloligella halotolerans]ODA68411.1 Alanine racemase, biosynthetic [Methyloligella halotolerans]